MPVTQFGWNRTPLRTVVEPPDDRLDRATIFRPWPSPTDPSSRNRCFELRPLGISQNLHRLCTPTSKNASTTDADARLYKKAAGQAAKLCHIGHALMENRNGLVVDTSLTKATGTAEREAAIAMIGDLPDGGRITLGTDKAYDTQEFVAEMRRLGVTPHVTQNSKGRRSAIDGRTTRHVGYAASLRIRKRIEEVFGWMKTVGGLRKTRHRGTDRVGWMFTFVAAAYTLVRLPKLLLGRGAAKPSYGPAYRGNQPTFRSLLKVA